MQQSAAGGSGKVTPNLAVDAEGTRSLNLTVLQRLDPALEDILITAAHVTLYDFNIDLNRWSRKDVEGSLFVVKRNAQPRFQFIVMNRRNTDNLVEDLLGDFEYELQPPYLLYRNAAQEVNGIWFYNQHDCEAVANLFGRILTAYSKVPPKPKISAHKSEFEELEAVPTTEAMEGPLEPTTSSTSLVAEAAEESLPNYFNAALNVGSASNAPISGRQPSDNIVATSQVPLMIPSNISAHQLPPSLVPSSSPPVPLHDNRDHNANSGRATNLLTPSVFAPASSSAALLISPGASLVPTAPPLYAPAAVQRPSPYGAPLLQPFPPPAPPSSLTPVQNDGFGISRDTVRDALLRLVQNDQFIDLVYRELQNAHK